ncbi:MAG: outer membrane lipoprotein-sorting protein [bacterium]
MSLYLFFLVVSVFSIHCASSFKNKTPDLSQISPQFLQAKVRDNYLKLLSFEGKARVVIELPGHGYNGFASVYLNMPDSVLVKTEAMLGIDIGVLFMNHQLFGAYAPRENTFYYGEVKTLDLRDFLQVELTTEELYEVFTGLLQILVDSTSTVDFVRGKYVVTNQLSQGYVKQWVDPKKFLVTKSELFNERGQLILTKEFRRIHKTKGLMLPKTIRLTRPRAKERVTVYYTRQKVNKHIPAKKFKLKLPDNAKKIYWSSLNHPRVEREQIK